MMFAGVENMKIYLRVLFTIFLLTATFAVNAQDNIFGPGLAAFPYSTQRQYMMPQEGSASGEEPSNLIGPATYQFSALSGVPLENMSSGTTQLLGPPSDNGDSGLAPIGFLYRFDNAFYSTFGVNANGILRLGSTMTSSTVINTLDSTINSPKIAPYWDDLCLGMPTSKIHYKLVPGPIGVRKLVIEWRNVKITRGSGCFDGLGNGTFQVWLYDRTGVIQFVYGNGMVAPNPINGGYSVGIQSGAATNFASVNVSSSSVSYTTANNAQMAAIPAGTSYQFSPNIPAAVTGLTATPGQTSATLNWTDNANNETAYLVLRTTDHVIFYFVGSNLPANSTTFTDTGIEANTQYFYYVNPLTEGGIGADAIVGTTTLPAKSISSTSVGGAWSSPATWADSVVPDGGDNVSIADGATVVIDTAAAARSVTVGSSGSGLSEAVKGVHPEGGAPAALKFGETAAFSLTTGFNVTINSNGTLSTGGGNANQHVLTVRGDLINNGVFDLSTNNNQAGAALVFSGDSSNSFSGTGPVTDIRTITVDKGFSNNNVLEVSVSNFTVQGSTTDGPEAGYLYPVNGTYKISGTFTGNYRTFANPNYQIPANVGFVLNNPNYTVTAQHSAIVPVFGRLRISAGTFNVGTQANDSVVIIQGSNVVIEGGRVNTAGAFRSQADGTIPFSYSQTGGTITTCTVPGNGTCFSVMASPVGGDSITIPGGEIVIQNSGSSVIGNTVNMDGSTAVVRFGNEFTLQPSNFALEGDDQPNIVIDTRGGGHALQITRYDTTVKNVEIGAGGLFDTNERHLTITGESIVNNGLIMSTGFQSKVAFNGENPVYSGSGAVAGIVRRMTVSCQTLTLNSVNNLRVRELTLATGTLINSGKLTLGNNDSTESSIYFGDFSPLRNGGSLDSAPVFELGTGGQNVGYSGNGPDQSTSVEINPSRVLKSLRYNNFRPGAKLNIEGGDVTVADLHLTEGEIATGQYKIIHNGGIFLGVGRISGELERPFTLVPNNNIWYFVSGQVFVGVESLGPPPTRLSIRSIPGPLPGLLPATSLSRRWQITETGDITAQLSFSYTNAEIRGNESNYQIWRSTGGSPTLIPFAEHFPGTNTITTVSGITELTGLWGVGEMVDPGPVSISGTVLTSGGAGIRNAVVTITGGNLPGPVNAQTGQFGTYLFSGLQAGEVYTVRVSAKRFRFSINSQQVTPFADTTGVNFTANPQDEF
jgi:hypothetical protein